MALDYLPSPGWAVIYGETPSATRWSELGDNDDALATGAGIDDLAILTRHLAANAVTGAKILNYSTKRQNDTTNTTESAALIQTGWGRMTMGGGSAYNIENVVFPTAYTSAPIVILTPGGDRTAAQGAGTYGQGGNNVHGQIYGGALEPTTVGFKAKVGTSAGGGTYSAGDTVYYQWIAIGV